jgi:tetratricopeptide (TPR) repeat protein
MEHASRLLGSLAACAVTLLGCGAGPTTQRVFHGEVVVGPYVEPEAYAAFAEGVYLEQRGDQAGAMRAFRRAQALDEDSPGIAARLGALICRTNLEAALDEFRTSDVARDYAPAWVGRALCLSRHGQSARALEAAHRAVMLEPGNPEANLLIAELHRAGARPERARAWLFAWALADGNAATHGRELEARARLLGDPALGALARSSNEVGRAEVTDEDLGGAPPPTAARAALLATARGEPELAARYAALALQANPNDADALVIALFAASLSLDDERFLDLLGHARASTAPEPEAAALMAELIRCRVGDDAAESWRAAYRRRTAPASAAPAP